MTKQAANITVADVQHEGEDESYKVVTISNLSKDQVVLLRCILQDDNLFGEPAATAEEWGFDPEEGAAQLDELNALARELETRGY